VSNCNGEADPDSVEHARAAMVAHGLRHQTVPVDVYSE